MIVIENVTKHFGDFIAVNDVSFTVNNGEIVGFVGLNGAGKTTTIRMIAGVLIQDNGRIKVDDHDTISEKKEVSKNLGWVPELPIFEQDAKAWDYFVYLAGFYGISSNDAKRMARQLFDELGLAGFEKRKLATYSQGMKKRFSLAVSLISNPGNFIFDEVFNGLDPQGIQFFRDLASKFRNEGKAILLSSHILSELESIADKIVFIHKGRIIKQMSMDEVRRYVSPSLKIKVDRVSVELIDYLSKYGKVREEGGYIIIDNFNGNTADVSKEISALNLNLYEMSVSSSSLEEVFFKVIGDQK
ncbi:MULTISPECIES: ABC transporter ATP-binding protein [Acidianus]|uniref:ABC transporter ATP-binding protein n=1 Tax=Candidatus Acidianus copahuensis TaxID=1160895 RepID=A0A031LRV6_9CREN|nr:MULTISPECIES: ABC transporter ATP-binding protein [Acidianus]EZQ10551.1 ABC transporter ATP-binding protein [Candidatus Acidianus copahuensis]NON61984.1 ABC transporter ATP-binding protein [Acidianus sp. RZ1]